MYGRAIRRLAAALVLSVLLLGAQQGHGHLGAGTSATAHQIADGGDPPLPPLT
jgi:hypothetical protein